MPWVESLAAAVLALGIFWTPGWATLAAAGVGGLSRFALAPVVTTFVCGVGAITVGILGLRWNLVSFCVASAVGVSAAWFARRRAGRGLDSAEPPVALVGSNLSRPWAVALGVVTGSLSILVPLAVGIGSPDRTMAAWDGLFHLNAIEYIRDTGRASPFEILDFYRNGPHQGVYPTGWHTLAALVPTWPSRGVVFTVVAYVPLAVAWTLGLALLARVIAPHHPHVVVIAPLLAATGAVPVYAESALGVVANAWALSLTPACLASLLIARQSLGPRIATLAAVCVVGLGLAHPGPTIAIAVMGAPAYVPALGRRALLASRRRAGRLFLLVSVAAVVCVSVVAFQRTALGTVLRMSGAAATTWPWSAFDVVNGSQGTTVASSAILVALAGAGAVTLWADRRLRQLVLGVTILLALPVVADPALPWAAVLIRPWFSEVSRLAPVAWSFVVVLAAYGLVEQTQRLVRSGRLVTTLLPDRTLAAVAGILLVAVVTPTALGSSALAARSLTDDPASDPYITHDELQMIYRLPRELKSTQAVLGSTYSGAAHLYGLIGQAVALPYHFSVPDRALQYVTDHLQDLAGDARLCRALASEHIAYLYIDSAPTSFDPVTDPFRIAPLAGVRLVDRGGSAAVYEITACQ